MASFTTHFSTLAAAATILFAGLPRAALAEDPQEQYLSCLNTEGEIVNPSCTHLERANEFVKLGRQAADSGNYDDAIQAFDGAIGTSPKDAIAYYDKGLALTAIRYYKDAIEAYGQAIAHKGNFAEAFNNLCYVNNVLGKYKEAIADCEHAIKLDGKQANFFLGLANVYYKMGNYVDALQNYRMSIELNTRNGNAAKNGAALLGEARVFTAERLRPCFRRS